MDFLTEPTSRHATETNNSIFVSFFLQNFYRFVIGENESNCFLNLHVFNIWSNDHCLYSFLGKYMEQF